jgi:hypothetical protein
MADNIVTNAVLTALISLAQQNKSYGSVLVQVTRELFALEASVKGLDPSFSDVLAQKRQAIPPAEISVLTAQVSEMLKSTDGLIEGLKQMQNELRG